MAREFQEIEKFLKGLDARAYTTPIGAVLGLAAVRSLMPKKKRTWKTYGVGGTLGAGAGLAAGTGIEAIRDQEESPKKPDTTIPSRADELTKKTPPKPAIPGIYRREGVPSKTEKELLDTSLQMMREIGNSPNPDPVKADAAHRTYLEMLVKTDPGGYRALLEPPRREERLNSLALAGGLLEVPWGTRASAGVKRVGAFAAWRYANTNLLGLGSTVWNFIRDRIGRWSSDSYGPKREKYPSFFAHMWTSSKTGRLLFLRDDALNAKATTPKSWAARAILYNKQLQNTAGDLATYENRLKWLDHLTTKETIPLPQRLNIDNFKTQLKIKVAQKQKQLPVDLSRLQIWLEPEKFGLGVSLENLYSRLKKTKEQSESLRME